MRIDHSSFTKIRHRCWIIILILLMLPACNIREEGLSAREASISARESELVTLFAELVEQRKALEKIQPDKFPKPKSNSSLNKTNTCPCDDTNGIDTSQKAQSMLTDTRTILGGLENVYLDPPGLEFSARIDTGARTSSLNAIDIVEFERDGKPFVKFNVIHPQTGEMVELTRRLRRYIRVKERGDRESQRRPVVRMRVVLADINEQIDFTLENRSKFRHQVLIGRNLLRDLAIVDVSKRFTTIKIDNLENGGLK